jgi:predicted MPP superfamily phosphohydrolase
MMPRWLGFILFVSIFSGICLAGYYYILARLFLFFKLKQTITFWALVVVLGFGYIGFSMLERAFPCELGVFLVRLSAIGLGVGWLCLVVLVSHDVLYLLFRFPVAVSRWPAVGAMVVLCGYAFVNARRIEIDRIELPAPVTMRVVQLSDIHIGSVTQRHLGRLVEQTNALRPDVVLITGDLVDTACILSPETLSLLDAIQAPAYFTLGNHEGYAGVEKVMDALRETSVIALRNEATVFNGIQLVGIDDREDHTWVGQALPGIHYDPAAYTILMYHRPDGFDAAANAGVDLMLTGHTHNGQIWPFNYIVQTRFKYLKGLHSIGDMSLYVSTGSGTWGPPMRLGSRNQITLIDLKKND